MICYAVIDTNVLVSALLSSHSESATVQVVERLFSGEIIPVFSAEILREYHEVLRRRKFHFSEELVSTFLGAVEKFGELVSPSPSGMLLPDMKDLPFYEVVLEKREADENTYLVTGNMKHFPQEPFIVTAKQMMDILSCNLE